MASNSASSVFQIKNMDVSTLPIYSLREGFYGETLEAGLQKLLAEHPEVLPGHQLVNDGEVAPRFLLLKREAAVGAWSLDHLFIDQFSVPTLVECKLLENRESRREVIGQIIEYAANARAVWGEGKLRDLTNNVWSSRKGETDELLKSELAIDDVDAFWELAESNLQSGLIRLIIAGDHVHTSVQRMIEFLNTEMQNTEVYGLEVNGYGHHSDNVVLMINVIGRVQSTVDKRAARSTLPLRRDLIEIREHYETLENKEASATAISLLDWACTSERYSQARTIRPSFHIESALGQLRIGVYEYGAVWVYWRDMKEQDRQAVRKELQDKGLTDNSTMGDYGFTLENITADTTERLFEILNRR